MRAVLTRVSRASVKVDGHIIGRIDCPESGGLLALVGVSRQDVEDESTLAQAVEKMAGKISQLRVLDGETSLIQANAPVLLVSQFTLYGQTARGRRPSWSQAAPAELAEPAINMLAQALTQAGVHVEHGKFGAQMQVESVNEGPFTVLVET